MYPVLLELGHFQLRSYGVVVALSFLLALWVSTREAQRKGLDPGIVNDFAFYALLDRSRFFSPALILSLQTDLDLTLGVQFFGGSPGSEYARLNDVYYAQLKWVF